MSNLNDMQDFHKTELFYKLANNTLSYLSILESNLTDYQRQTVSGVIRKFRSVILNEHLNRTDILRVRDRLSIVLSLGQSQFKDQLKTAIIDSLDTLFDFNHKIDQIVFAKEVLGDE
jgi:hypothetical protein